MKLLFIVILPTDDFDSRLVSAVPSEANNSLTFFMDEEEAGEAQDSSSDEEEIPRHLPEDRVGHFSLAPLSRHCTDSFKIKIFYPPPHETCQDK